MDKTVRFWLWECYKKLTVGRINLVDRQTNAIILPLGRITAHGGGVHLIKPFLWLENPRTTEKGENEEAF